MSKHEVDVKELELYTTQLEEIDLTLVLGLNNLSHAQLQSLQDGIQQELEEREI